MTIDRRGLIQGALAASAAGLMLPTSAATAAPRPITRAIPSTGESMPIVGLGVLLLLSGLIDPVLGGAPAALPVTGSGLLLLSLGFMLFLSGAIGELIFKTGDIRPEEFAALTLKYYSSNPVSTQREDSE